MLPDESLPEALPKPKVVLSLMPYKANTPYNWDPVFQKKIRMDKNTKIYVAGHHGLVGSAIWNNLQRRGYTNLVGRSHKELDLLDGVAVKQFFDEEQPDAVVL